MLPHQSSNLIKTKGGSVGKDSYPGLCHAPLPAPSAIVLNNNQGTSSSFHSTGGEKYGWGRWREFRRGRHTFKRPDLHILLHITDVLPHLRWKFIKTFRKQRRDRREEDLSQASLICICMCPFKKQREKNAFVLGQMDFSMMDLSAAFPSEF